MTTTDDLDWAWRHPRLPSPGPPADVELWVDPTDSLTVLRSVQALHDPSAGRVVVSPTPASRSGLTLITDVLAALGVEWRLRLGNLTDHAVDYAVERMATAGIRELYVLRSHRLAPIGWWCLRRLVSPHQVRLVLVLHATEATVAQLSTLDGCRIRSATPSLVASRSGFATVPPSTAWWSKEPFKAGYRQAGPGFLGNADNATLEEGALRYRGPRHDHLATHPDVPVRMIFTHHHLSAPAGRPARGLRCTQTNRRSW
jgi:hypothetical protein